MRTLRGLGALALLLALLVGIPVALIALAGNPTPDIPALVQALTGVDYGGRVLMGTILPLIGWIAWASFAVSVVIELGAQARNVSAPKLKGLGAQQALAGGLVAAVLALGASPAMAQEADSAPTGTSSPSLTQTLESAVPNSGPQAGSPTELETEPQARTYTVQPGDTLVGIADQQLGDESRWADLAENLKNVEQTDGREFVDPDLIYVGWEVPLATSGAGSTAVKEGSAEADIPAAPTDGATPGATSTRGADGTAGTSGTSDSGEADTEAPAPGADATDRLPGGVARDASADADAAVERALEGEEADPAAQAPAASAGSTPQPQPSQAPQQAKSEDSETDEAQSAAESEKAAQDREQANRAREQAQEQAKKDAEAVNAAAAAAPRGEEKEQSQEAAVPGATFSKPVEKAADPSGALAADQAAVEGADEIDWRTVGGIGATLAAGVLGLIGARRLAQRRRRKPGQQVPRPAGEDAQLEAQLRTVADQPAVDELDLVLRAVALWAGQEQITLPEMFCVRVTEEQIALYLAAPAMQELPAPFVREDDEGTVWTIESGLIEGLPEVPEAPYPALVTVGKDDTGAQMLLDLEYLGTLGLEGEGLLVSEALDAMAVELATSAWGEFLQVTLVGVAPGLASAVGTGRVRQVDDLDELLRMLAGRADDVKAALEEAGVRSVHEAKGAGIEQEWAPEIVLLGTSPTDEQADQLRELTRTIPRLGVAAVTTQNPLSAPWRLDLVDKDNADLEPAGLHLTPQRITATEAQRIIAVLATALADPEDTDATGTHTVDLAAILGRPATHLTIVPNHAEEGYEYEIAGGEEGTDTTESAAAPAESLHEDEHEETYGVEVTTAPADPVQLTTPVHEDEEEQQEEQEPLAPVEAVQTAPAETQGSEQAPTDTEEPAPAAEPLVAESHEPTPEQDVEPAAESAASAAAPGVEETTGQAQDEPLEDQAQEQALVEDVEPAAEPATAQAEPGQLQAEEDAELVQQPAPAPQAPDAEVQEPALEDPEVEVATPAAAAATVTRLAPETEESELDRQATDLLNQVTPEVPLISLLGPMRIIGARGEAPVSGSTGKVSVQLAERCVALAAYLALHPGSSAEAFHAAFWPNATPTGATASSNRNKLAAQTRKYLGQEEDGTLFFPRASSEGYQLDPRVTTDWQILVSLIGDDPATVSTPALVAAMRLIRGAPFQHAKSKNVAWADDLHQQMVERICDAAHELVHRALTAGHNGHAQLAARVGRTVDPASEAMWRDAITAEAAAGNREEVSRLVDQLYKWLEEFEEGLEPEEETVELIDTLREHGYRVVA
ncbi:hypothetical protein V3N95_11835 (plasmid) [Micrococcaceae bacterium Sec6.3]